MARTLWEGSDGVNVDDPRTGVVTHRRNRLPGIRLRSRIPGRREMVVRKGTQATRGRIAIVFRIQGRPKYRGGRPLRRNRALRKSTIHLTTMLAGRDEREG